MKDKLKGFIPADLLAQCETAVRETFQEHFFVEFDEAINAVRRGPVGDLAVAIIRNRQHDPQALKQYKESRSAVRRAFPRASEHRGGLCVLDRFEHHLNRRFNDLGLFSTSAA